MTEMTPHTDSSPTFLPPRDEYAQITDLATRLAGTAFVPSGLRGDRGESNPPAVLAAMLTGRELGLAPMESLRSIHMIEGKPTLSAEATMKLAQEAGNLLIVTETTRERATVKYRNASWPDDEPARELTFDLEDAELAGLTGRKMWNKYPRAMLRSRAITEAARAGGLLSGSALAYTAEEMTDDSDVEDGTVEDAVVVESISPDEEDEDELATRRGLHRRAAAAYKRACELDEDAAATAWASAGAGLGSNPWAEADVDVLEIRVGDLERIAAQLEAEHDDGGEGDGGTPSESDPDDSPDSGDAQDSAPDAPDPIDEYEAELAPEALEDGYDEPAGTCGCGEPHWPDEDVCSQCGADLTLAIAYPNLNVAQVGDLLRNHTTELDDGTDLTLDLDVAGGILAWCETIERLETEHHDPFRKTVRASLENAGWTPKGRERLADARVRAAMDDGAPSADETGPPAGEGGEAGTTGPEGGLSAETATESDPPDGVDDLTVAELLDVAGDVVEELDQAGARRFRDRLSELIDESEDGVPDRGALLAMVRHAKRLVAGGTS